MRVMVVGDIHGYWGNLNTLINHKKPDLILQCGDFGYWPGHKKFEFEQLKLDNTIIRWCDGNHENHWELAKRESDEVAPGVIYMPRGSTYTLPDGRNVLFMGGADSIDKAWRTIGYDWFPEEIITQKDILDLPDMKIDIVISHTCPRELIPVMSQIDPIKDKDPSYIALSEVYKKYKPSLWFFGHFHYYKTGTYQDMTWHCIGATRKMTQWWMWLPD